MITPHYAGACPGARARGAQHTRAVAVKRHEMLP